MAILLFGVAHRADPAAGQGLAQVNITGIPPVLESPVVSDVARGFEQGRFPMTFIFNSPDRQPSDFVFRVHLEREGQTVLALTSDVARYTRGVYTYTTLDAEPPIRFSIGYQEIIDALSASLNQNLERTGLLSEGVYTLTVEAIPTDPDQLVVAVPGSAVFSVQYLEPPVLINPPPDGVVGDRLPVFSWLPVLGGAPGTTFDYEFLLVEVYPEQEPLQAIEANRPVEALLLNGLTTLPYTADRLPLEPGKRYAWQVSARDAEGLVPFTDDGRSEISTFVYAPSGLSLARWIYPFSRPPIVFNLADAEVTLDGYSVRGYYYGTAGGAPVTALFDDVLLDASTLEMARGSVRLLGERAEAVGIVESDVSRNILVDDTAPDVPFVTARVSQSLRGPRLNLSIGPSSDAESGVLGVDYRLVQLAADGSVIAGLSEFGWQSAFSSDEVAETYAGDSYGIDLSAGAEELMQDGVLGVQVRIVNGLGLEVISETRIGAGTDLSPPIVVKPAIAYSGYYDPDRPNSVEISEMSVTDGESRIRSIEYRISGSDSEPGSWQLLSSPDARTYRTPVTFVEVPPADRDTSFVIEFRVTNDARLSTLWSERIEVDVDETIPVQTGPLARFVTSESDPRIEILREAIADYQSGVRALSFRVVDDENPNRLYVDWTDFSPGAVAEVKRTQLNFTTRRAVQVEVRARNGAGLETTFTESLSVPELSIGDTTPPSVPALTVRVLQSAPGTETVLELLVGASADLESGISRVQYRIDEPGRGTDLTGWVDLPGVTNGSFEGAAQTISVSPATGATSLRATVRVVNGSGRAITATGRVAVAAEDRTPPDVRDIQVYAQAGRILAFVDGLSDDQSTIARVDYRLLRTDGTPLTGWIAHPLVPSGRSSYGRQLIRADIPAATTGPQIIFRLRVTNGVGLETTVEEAVSLER